MNNDLLKNVTEKLNNQTRTLLEQLCTDDDWTAKVLGCDKKALEESIVSGLESFGKCSTEEQTEHLECTLKAIPNHLNVLEPTGKSGGKSAIKRAQEFISRVAKECSGDAEDVSKLMVLCTLRFLQKDLFSQTKTDDENKSESNKKTRNFTIKGEKSEDDNKSEDRAEEDDNQSKASGSKKGEKRNNDKKPEMKKSVITEWIARVASSKKLDKVECAADIFNALTNAIKRAKKEDAVDKMFKNYKVSDLNDVADWVADRIFSKDARVLTLSTDEKTFEKQIVALVTLKNVRTIPKCLEKTVIPKDIKKTIIPMKWMHPEQVANK